MQAPPQKSILVTFHAIVPKPLWEWDDSSSMHIQFGHRDLGEWQHNTGVFMEARYLRVLVGTLHMYTSSTLSSLRDDDYQEMTCTLNIQAELLKNPLEYKYVIFSPKMTGKDDCYEFLHAFAGMWARNFNRCLSVDQKSLSLAVGGNTEY